MAAQPRLGAMSFSPCGNGAFAQIGPVLIHCSRLPVGGDEANRVRETFRALTERPPEERATGLLLVVAPLPGSRERADEAERKAWASLAQDPGDNAVGAAIAMTATGFAGATQRAIISGILLAARASKPVRVFNSIEEAAAWLCATLDAGGGTTKALTTRTPDLVTAAEAILAAIDEGIARSA